MRYIILFVVACSLQFLTAQTTDLTFSGPLKSKDIFVGMEAINLGNQHFCLIHQGPYTMSWETKHYVLEKYDLSGKQVFSKKLDFKIDGKDYFPNGMISMNGTDYLFLSSIKKRERTLYLTSLNTEQGTLGSEMVKLGSFKIVGKVAGFDSSISANEEYLAVYFEQENKMVVLDKQLNLARSFETQFKFNNPVYSTKGNSQNFMVRNNGDVVFYNDNGKKTGFMEMFKADGTTKSIAFDSALSYSNKSGSLCFADLTDDQWAVAGVYIAAKGKVDFQGVFAQIFDAQGNLQSSFKSPFTSMEFPLTEKRMTGGLPKYAKGNIVNTGISNIDTETGYFELDLTIDELSASTFRRSIVAAFPVKEKAFQEVVVLQAPMIDILRTKNDIESLNPFTEGDDKTYDIYSVDNVIGNNHSFYITRKDKPGVGEKLFDTKDNRLKNKHLNARLYDGDGYSLALFYSEKKYEFVIIKP